MGYAESTGFRAGRSRASLGKAAEWTSQANAAGHADKHAGQLGLGPEDYALLAVILARSKAKLLADRRVRPDGKASFGYDLRLALTPADDVVSLYPTAAPMVKQADALTRLQQGTWQPADAGKGKLRREFDEFGNRLDIEGQPAKQQQPDGADWSDRSVGAGPLSYKAETPYAPSRFSDIAARMAASWATSNKDLVNGADAVVRRIAAGSRAAGPGEAVGGSGASASPPANPPPDLVQPAGKAGAPTPPPPPALKPFAMGEQRKMRDERIKGVQESGKPFVAMSASSDDTKGLESMPDPILNDKSDWRTKATMAPTMAPTMDARRFELDGPTWNDGWERVDPTGLGGVVPGSYSKSLPWAMGQDSGKELRAPFGGIPTWSEVGLAAGRGDMDAAAKSSPGGVLTQGGFQTLSLLNPAFGPGQAEGQAAPAGERLGPEAARTYSDSVLKYRQWLEQNHPAVYGSYFGSKSPADFQQAPFFDVKEYGGPGMAGFHSSKDPGAVNVNMVDAVPRLASTRDFTAKTPVGELPRMALAMDDRAYANAYLRGQSGRDPADPANGSLAGNLTNAAHGYNLFKTVAGHEGSHATDAGGLPTELVDPAVDPMGLSRGARRALDHGAGLRENAYGTKDPRSNYIGRLTEQLAFLRGYAKDYTRGGYTPEGRLADPRLRQDFEPGEAVGADMLDQLTRRSAPLELDYENRADKANKTVKAIEAIYGAGAADKYKELLAQAEAAGRTQDSPRPPPGADFAASVSADLRRHADMGAAARERAALTNQASEEAARILGAPGSALPDDVGKDVFMNSTLPSIKKGSAIKIKMPDGTTKEMPYKQYLELLLPALGKNERKTNTSPA